MVVTLTGNADGVDIVWSSWKHEVNTDVKTRELHQYSNVALRADS